MPERDGFDVFGELRRRHGREPTPILMLSGVVNSASVDHAYAVRATDFMRKPINESVG